MPTGEWLRLTLITVSSTPVLFQSRCVAFVGDHRLMSYVIFGSRFRRGLEAAGMPGDSCS